MRTFLAVVFGISVGVAIAVTVAARAQQGPPAPTSAEGGGTR